MSNPTHRMECNAEEAQKATGDPLSLRADSELPNQVGRTLLHTSDTYSSFIDLPLSLPVLCLAGLGDTARVLLCRG